MGEQGLARLVEILPAEGSNIGSASRDEDSLPPWIFRHSELIEALESADTVDQKTLIGTLNHIHFMDGHIRVLLRHPKYHHSVFLRACPGPCFGKELSCRWSDENLSGLKVETYQFQHLVIDDGLSVVIVPAVLKQIDRNIIITDLPHKSYILKLRQTRRFVCRGVVAGLTQSGFQANGKLLDFSPVGFRIRVSPVAPASFHWLNLDELLAVDLRRGQQLLFSGQCRLVREQGHLKEKEIVLAPAYEEINRFQKRPIRNPRQQLVPSPTLIFEHPFTEKSVQLVVSDMSTSGFSVYEDGDEGILMQGMLIPELWIDFAGASRMKCCAQVVYRREEKEKGVRCGLAILDMEFSSYSRLAHIINNAKDPHAYISCNVDIDALWEVFFRTGFIYPMKYRYIQFYREDLKKTYRKFYQNNVEVAGHFTYQKNGRIYGHISMVRAYERTLLLQHHIGRAMKGFNHNGVKVLEQAIYYINDIRRLHTAKVDYVMCYFRPDNAFPNKVFGDFARDLNNPQVSSLDLFSYLPFQVHSTVTPLPEGWMLKKTSKRDLSELNRFYSHHSRGLLLNALGLEQVGMGSESLEEVYARSGFIRRLELYSLTKDNDLIALLIANQSDVGLNLSEFLNGIKILIAKETEDWKIISSAIAQLAHLYNMKEIPILIYPMEYVETNRIAYEKQYQLWILNLRYGNEYLEYNRIKYGFGDE